MTPFMLAVQALLDGEVAPPPGTEPSRQRSVAVATDAQVMIRSLAEQLVSEANAILREHGCTDAGVISLVDDSGPGELAFTLGYGDRAARVQTVLSGRSGVGRLVVAGRHDQAARQLASDEEMQALVLSLLEPIH